MIVLDLLRLHHCDKSRGVYIGSYWNCNLLFQCLCLSHMAFKNNLLLCTPLECQSMEEMQASMEKAKAEGADLVELCLDSMSFSHISEVQKLIKLRTLPAIVSFRYLLCSLLLLYHVVSSSFVFVFCFSHLHSSPKLLHIYWFTMQNKGNTMSPYVFW